MVFFNNFNWRIDLLYGYFGWGLIGYRLRVYVKGGCFLKGEIVLVGENGLELFEVDIVGIVYFYEKIKVFFN